MEHESGPEKHGVGIGTVVAVSLVCSLVMSCLVGVTLTAAGLVALAERESRQAAASAEEPADVELDDEPPLTAEDRAWGEDVTGTFTPDGPAAHLYRFRLPRDAVYVRAELTTGDHDLDLRVTFGEQDAREEDWRVTADGSSGDEVAWVVRDDDPDFALEPFMVRVDSYTTPEEPVPFTLTLTVVEPTATARLRPGARASGVVSEDTGHRADYELVLPEDEDTVRIDLLSVRQDLDVAADTRPVIDPRRAAFAADTATGREGLVLRRGELGLGPGEHVLHVAVVDRGWTSRVIPFEIVASAGEDAPFAVRRLPELPEPRSDAERAALGVVGLRAGDGEGSGVVVGEAGRILTAAHVVEEVPLDADEVVILVTTDVALEPEELLLGRVIRRDDELDVAIVEVRSTFHGERIPRSWRLPRTPTRWTEPVTLGEDVHACGFPVLHDSGERSEVTWTSGVVCGFERPHGHDLIRFDAVISAGSSGGALLDASYRLVGITVAMHGDLSAFSATGLALPLDEVPEDWRALLE